MPRIRCWIEYEKEEGDGDPIDLCDLGILEPVPVGDFPSMKAARDWAESLHAVGPEFKPRVIINEET